MFRARLRVAFFSIIVSHLACSPNALLVPTGIMFWCDSDLLCFQFL